ncbi:MULTISPECIES: sigma-70 family RNA polymerase sigma factor [Clostridium]|uniref:RNA polymerase sigma-70 factor, ECF subfamily n=1 Tax=Clostridium cadaveris TaxID=1529 RepID=A0A1I2QX94_9CLOT|nr:sigma-70 family RNA polymerase sigma factor [Clostridium cadaveris]MDU4953970.1 sigma-70 family RNA polymerase sigma factor [Clostridium sp.]MDM8313580.1 sigma-70 family RNA polymerase sigma factor [Clostridium cadaveris]MDY4948807.1 sigma-70 family RNA polymerase sigma factor [Clostridium cadaveris]NME63459.1 sigma-70 family RNA polymerase sigma factor [Clostridium cadaveris]NWK09731.1 sigma-70 family RNA polymerase sigma factor [Clostridium cadaveris]
MEILIYKAQRGNREAFIKAINSCTKQLYKIGKSMRLNDEDIGDAMQETILTAYKKINTLKEPKFFKTWLVRIFINKCNSILNSNKKIVLLDDFKAVEEVCEVSSNEDLQDAIDQLKEDYKNVINLYYIMGYSIREISYILEEKEGTVKSKLSRARSELRKVYKSKGEVI